MAKQNAQNFMRIDWDNHDKLVKIRDQKRLKTLNAALTELLKGASA